MLWSCILEVFTGASSHVFALEIIPTLNASKCISKSSQLCHLMYVASNVCEYTFRMDGDGWHKGRSHWSVRGCKQLNLAGLGVHHSTTARAITRSLSLR
jgi:hypothetical protein